MDNVNYRGSFNAQIKDHHCFVAGNSVYFNPYNEIVAHKVGTFVDIDEDRLVIHWERSNTLSDIPISPIPACLAIFEATLFEELSDKWREI